MRRLPFAPDAGADCLQGHFPGRPIIPGVVLLRAAIDAAGLSGPMRIERAKFLQPCAPQMALSLVLDERDGRVDLRVEHRDRLVASARIIQTDGAGGGRGHG